MADVMKVLGASNHSKEEREENDYYATPAVAVEELLKIEKFNNDILLEPAIGGGHIAKLFENKKQIIGYDIIDRGYPNTIIKDFCKVKKEELPEHYDIITNPPYGRKTLLPFVTHCLDISPKDTKIAMLLKLQFLESEKRYLNIFRVYPPNRVHIFVKRISCYKNGDFSIKDDSAICYCWYVWDKNESAKTTTVDWIYRK